MTKTAYLSYYDEINEAKTRQLMAACEHVVNTDAPDRLYFLFSSTGGSLDAGIALYNFLRALPVPVVMHNTGSIQSIANVIFLAADERYAAPSTSFHMHGITWNFAQGTALSWSQLQEVLSSFRVGEARMLRIMRDRTSLTEAELLAMFHQGESKDPDFAKDKGMIQEIRPASVPPGSPFYALNFA